MRVELLGGRREECDDCHDDELRQERRMRVELLGGRREARDDCHDDELRQERRMRRYNFIVINL